MKSSISTKPTEPYRERWMRTFVKDWPPLDSKFSLVVRNGEECDTKFLRHAGDFRNSTNA